MEERLRGFDKVREFMLYHKIDADIVLEMMKNIGTKEVRKDDLDYKEMYESQNKYLDKLETSYLDLRSRMEEKNRQVSELKIKFNDYVDGIFANSGTNKRKKEKNDDGSSSDDDDDDDNDAKVREKRRMPLKETSTNIVRKEKTPKLVVKLPGMPNKKVKYLKCVMPGCEYEMRFATRNFGKHITKVHHGICDKPQTIFK